MGFSEKDSVTLFVRVNVTETLRVSLSSLVLLSVNVAVTSPDSVLVGWTVSV